MNDDQFNLLILKIDKLTKIIALKLIQDSTNTNKQKIIELFKIGFNISEISEIVGTTANTVSKELSVARKEGLIK